MYHFNWCRNISKFSVGVLGRATVKEGANADTEQRSHSAIRTRQSATESNSFFSVCPCRYSAAAWDRGGAAHKSFAVAVGRRLFFNNRRRQMEKRTRVNNRAGRRGETMAAFGRPYKEHGKTTDLLLGRVSLCHSVNDTTAGRSKFLYENVYCFIKEITF